MAGKGKGKQNEEEKEKEKEVDGIITDRRFAHLHTDPRFMRAPKQSHIVSIDARFQRMFHDANFSEASAVDKRGRLKPQRNRGHRLHQYYHLSEDQDQDQDEQEQQQESENEGLLRKKNEHNVKETSKGIAENDEDELFHSSFESTKGKKKKKKKKKMEDAQVGMISIAAMNDVEESELSTEKRKKKKKKEKMKLFKWKDTLESEQNTDAKKKKNEVIREDRRAEVPKDTKTKKKRNKLIGKDAVEPKQDAEIATDDVNELDNRLSAVDLAEFELISGKTKKKKKKNKKKGKETIEKDEENPEQDAEDIGDDAEQGGLENVFVKDKRELNPSRNDEEERYPSTDDEEDQIDETDDSSALSDGSETSESMDSDAYDDVSPETEFKLPHEEEVPMLESETRRLAAVNMDWNHVKAVDLLVLMNSFLPKGGQILSVAIYPSEFGVKRMAEEAVHGPAIFQNDESSSDDEDDESINEKLRQYEKDRLRYYFAVIECDSPATADYIYKACDRVEFERTSNVMDLRFVPDDMEFKHPPRDIATQVPDSYDAPDFRTRALQHSKVGISWDEDEPQRVKTLHRKFDPKMVDVMNFNDYLASDDSDSDVNAGDEDIQKLKSLIEPQHSQDSGDKDDDDKDMEVTFNIGLEDLSKRVSEKNEQTEQETWWDAVQRKRKEKKKERKRLAKQSSGGAPQGSDAMDMENTFNENQSDDFFLDENTLDAATTLTRKEEDASKAELELLLADDHGLENGIKGYNLKSKKSKGKKKSSDEEKLPTIDLEDPRFSALFTSHHFAIDPTDPHFRRSETYSQIISQRQQKKFLTQGDGDKRPTVPFETTDEEAHSKKRKSEISLLVRSVKRKAQKGTK